MRGKADKRLFALILDAVRKGASNRAAAAAAGVTEQSLYRWLGRGDVGDAPFAEFSAAFQRAKDEACAARVMCHVEAINRQNDAVLIRRVAA